MSKSPTSFQTTADNRRKSQLKGFRCYHQRQTEKRKEFNGLDTKKDS